MGLGLPDLGTGLRKGWADPRGLQGRDSLQGWRSWSLRTRRLPYSPPLPTACFRQDPCRKFQHRLARAKWPLDGVFPARWEQRGVSRRCSLRGLVSGSPRVPWWGSPPLSSPGTLAGLGFLGMGGPARGARLGTSWQTGNETKAAPYQAPHSFQVMPAKPGDSAGPEGLPAGRRTSPPRLARPLLSDSGVGEEDPAVGASSQAQAPWAPGKAGAPY